MLLLISGVVLWSVAHLFKRIAPQARSSLGNVGKVLVGISVLLSLWMMVSGYSSAENSVYWTRNSALVGINNLLMLFAIYLFVTSYIPVKVRKWVKHPQLAAVKAWALAHLLVNGDLASFVLFGGLLIWAVVSLILIKRQTEAAVSSSIKFSLVKELLAVVVTILAFGGIGMLHFKLGYPVFG